LYGERSYKSLKSRKWIGKDQFAYDYTEILSTYHYHYFSRKLVPGNLRFTHCMHPKLVVDAPLEKASGIVKRITFHSPESGFTVLKVTPFARPADEVAVVVHQSKVFAGATMDFYGEWGRHPQHGEQFKATKVVERKPATAHALEKYLGSGLIKGVGPVTASRIVKHFGKDTLDVFENHMERLVEVEGIAQLKLQMIAKAWQEHQEIRHVMMFLQSHNISTLFAVKIYKTYGNAAVELIQENPYRLAADIYGIGFLSADKVALSLGIAPDAPQRIRAAIDHVLQGSPRGRPLLPHPRTDPRGRRGTPLAAARQPHGGPARPTGQGRRPQERGNCPTPTARCAPVTTPIRCSTTKTTSPTPSRPWLPWRTASTGGT
jgi:ribosomal protein S13